MKIFCPQGLTCERFEGKYVIPKALVGCYREADISELENLVLNADPYKKYLN